MRDNSYDRTIERNYLQKWRFLIPEYEAVKAGRSTLFRRVGDFYRHHGTCSQTFRKYYNRYLQSGEEADLLPRTHWNIGVSYYHDHAFNSSTSTLLTQLHLYL